MVWCSKEGNALARSANAEDDGRKVGRALIGSGEERCGLQWVKKRERGEAGWGQAGHGQLGSAEP